MSEDERILAILLESSPLDETSSLVGEDRRALLPPHPHSLTTIVRAWSSLCSRKSCQDRAQSLPYHDIIIDLDIPNLPLIIIVVHKPQPLTNSSPYYQNPSTLGSHYRLPASSSYAADSQFAFFTAPFPTPTNPPFCLSCTLNQIAIPKLTSPISEAAIINGRTRMIV